jgi:two-component system NtrC family sensor kinase
MVGQLKQVFLNIILNALEAMPKGGELMIESGWSATHAEAESPGEMWVAFTDTGVGMSKQEISHIFSPFYTTKPNGTGLGLAISYDIIERHGGRIEVSSQRGKGSTFTVFLPVWKH